MAGPRDRDHRPGDRIPTPVAFGVQIPPAKARPPASPAVAPASLPPEDRELVLERLREVSENFASFRDELTTERGRDLQWRSGVEERLEQHAEDILRLREIATISREMRQEQREQGHLIGELARDVRSVMRTDAVQTIDLGKLEARVVAAVGSKSEAIADAAGTTAGNEAGSKAGRRWGIVTILVTLAAISVEKCGPSFIKMMGGPHVDPPAKKAD